MQSEWVKCQVCDAREQALSELEQDDPRHGKAWAPIPIDHFPYDDPSEPFMPWHLKPRELE